MVLGRIVNVLGSRGVNAGDVGDAGDADLTCTDHMLKDREPLPISAFQGSPGSRPRVMPQVPAAAPSLQINDTTSSLITVPTDRYTVMV